MTDPIEEKARRITDEIIEDLTDRRGLRQAWDATDEDVREEIRQSWQTIVSAALRNNS